MPPRAPSGTFKGPGASTSRPSHGPVENPFPEFAEALDRVFIWRTPTRNPSPAAAAATASTTLRSDRAMQSMAGSCELFVAALVPLVMSQVVRLEQSDAATWISWELSGAAEINPMLIFARRANLQGISVGSTQMFEAMNRAIAVIRLKPIIDKVFSFDDAPAAYRYLQSAQHFGKVVISVG
jgi:D-arabinose 1-dehydrogenase-like Zn-dependent alcohol dehydrogenase